MGEIQRALDEALGKPADDEGHIVEATPLSLVHELRTALSKYDDAATVAETLLLEDVRLRLVAQTQLLNDGVARCSEQLRLMDSLCRNIRSNTEQLRVDAKM